jgi:hypothetical protein
MGMGFGKANTVKPTKQRTFFENVMGSLKEPLFTAWLRPGMSKGLGSYDFGWIDKRKYSVRLSRLPIFYDI